MNASDLVNGGVYASRSTQSEEFTISKIIMIDGDTVYVTIYKEMFRVLPDFVDTRNLNEFVVATPIAFSGFAAGATLIVKESVTKREIADYNTQIRLQSNDFSILDD